MIKFTTVQELIDGGYKLHANRHNWHCQNNQALDLVDLRERLGPDFLLAWLLAKRTNAQGTGTTDIGSPATSKDSDAARARARADIPIFVQAATDTGVRHHAR